MSQVKKFYWASFLKNQTYFVPIMVIFFQDLGLNYSQIFWIFTIGSVFSFIIEIPTGVLADLYGKRFSIILSKLVIFISFVVFGLANGFWVLMLANLLYELGKSFRSGTETAYVYDYLDQTGDKTPNYTWVKADQKFYARLSESIAAIIGGWLAVKYGFNWVFLMAAIPAFINFALSLGWEQIESDNGKKTGWQHSWKMAKCSLKEVWHNKFLLRLLLNIMFFSLVFFALGKFVQPYMFEAGIKLEYFGVVYSAFLLLTAFLVRYADILQEKIGGTKLMNWLTLLALAPLIILGLGHVSWLGVALFFMVLVIDNLRSPISNDVFHENVQSNNRATMGSIMELSKTASQLLFLPLIGYLADWYSMFTAILLLAGVLLITIMFFWLPNKTKN